MLLPPGLVHFSLCRFLLIFPTPTDLVQYLDFCFPSLLTYLMILSSHMAFDITCRLMAPIFLSLELSPEHQTSISTCLLIISARVINRHLKLYIPTPLSCSFSCSANGSSIFPDEWIQNLAVIYDSSLAHLPSIPSANSLSSIFKRYLKSDYFSAPPLLPP